MHCTRPFNEHTHYYPLAAAPMSTLKNKQGYIHIHDNTAGIMNILTSIRKAAHAFQIQCK